jgi:hypothetical protein
MRQMRELRDASHVFPGQFDAVQPNCLPRDSMLRDLLQCRPDGRVSLYGSETFGQIHDT